MRAWAPLAAVVLLGLAGCGGIESSSAGCAGAQVTLSAPTVAVGGDLGVRAEYLLTDCYDTGQPGTPPPMEDVEVALVTGGTASRTFPLATLDATDDGRIDITVTVPADVPAGPATIRVAQATADLEIRPSAR